MRAHIVAASLATAPLIAAAQQAITITSPADTFRVNTTAQATVKRQGPFLEIALSKHSIWTSKKYKETSTVVSYRVSIATTNKDGRWETERSSSEVETPLTLEPGETKEVPPQKLSIPVDGITRLEKYFVVMRMKVTAKESHDGYGYTYAHSENLSLPTK